MVLLLVLAMAALVFLVLVFAFVIGRVVWGGEPWDPGARDREEARESGQADG
jgi:hypothetical protein